MQPQQELAERGLRRPDGGQVVDLCEHIPSGGLYVIAWSEADGQLLASHGPISAEEVPALAIPRLSWTADHHLDGARSQQWRPRAMLAEAGF